MNCNDYSKYEKKFVFFIDVLGFKNIVDKEKKPSDVIKVIKALSEIFERENKEKNSKLKFDFKITQISDCIIISFNTSKNFEFYYLLLLMAKAQIDAFIKHDLLFRGGGAYGEMVHDDKYLFGKAYQEAYKIESKKAKYPRIVFKKELLDLIPNEVQKELAMELLEEDEEYYYMDFINLLSTDHFKEEEQIKNLNITKSIIEKNMDKERKILEKYEWLRDRYNKTVDMFNEKSTNKLDKINLN